MKNANLESRRHGEMQSQMWEVRGAGCEEYGVWSISRTNGIMVCGGCGILRSAYQISVRDNRNAINFAICYVASDEVRINWKGILPFSILLKCKTTDGTSWHGPVFLLNTYCAITELVMAMCSRPCPIANWPQTSSANEDKYVFEHNILREASPLLYTLATPA